jgi:hypothetical protein
LSELSSLELINVLKEGCWLMDDSHNRPLAETTWYENHEPIQEYLENSQKPANLKKDYQGEELSWTQIIENSNQN